MQPSRNRRTLKPLNPADLEAFALRYVSRYATTRKRLVDYLNRKLRERGWAAEAQPNLEALAQRFCDRGFIDDAGFAASREQALLRRGLGARRVKAALDQAGVGMQRAALDDSQAFEAATIFARRKHIGPYAQEFPDPKTKQRHFAAMIRAGHPIELVHKFVTCAPGEHPEPPESSAP